MVLHSHVRGRGTPFVLLHGLFGSGDNLSSLAARMEGLEVHLLDLRCHGRSPRSVEFSLGDLADDVAEYMIRTRLVPALVGGHSLGGKVAMLVALRYPELVRGLVCLDISPLASPSKYSEVLQALEEVDLGRLSGRTQAKEQLVAAIHEPAVLSFLLKSLVPDTGKSGAWRWLFDLAAIRKSFDEIWKGVGEGRTYPGPTLFVTGGDSDYFPARALDPTVEIFPQAVFSAVEGAGHWLHAENPVAVLQAIHGWLSDSHLAELPEWT